ncbi:MAG: DUF1566 domain-containing protein [Thermodesulfobacteriota bacterium]
MRRTPEVSWLIRMVMLLTVAVAGMMIMSGLAGCTTGNGKSGQDKADPPGCTDADKDDYYAEEGCGTSLDCNDLDATIHPGAREHCVDIDNDCDGLIDEGCTPEVCGDGVDNDGDGVADEECATGTSFVSDTGQARCYDSLGAMYPCPSQGQPFFGQDACYSMNSTPFTKLDANGNELPDDATEWSMVKDNVTGLVWEVKTDDGGLRDRDNLYDWEDAAGVFIAQLNADRFGGYSDWRFPAIDELDSIVRFGVSNPAINRRYFPNTLPECFWSSTTFASDETLAWSLGFNDGSIFIGSKEDGCHVRGVRGGQLMRTYTDNGDGTVTATDNGVSLMWARDSFVEASSWEDALAYCENLILAGYSDWRLPDIKELRSLVDYERHGPAIDLNYFPDTTLDPYWSSTTYTESPGDAWVVGFYSGGSNGGEDKNRDASKVRAVRGGLE